MKGRLYRVALLAMLFAIDGQQPFIPKAATTTITIPIVIPLEHAAVGKIAWVLYQHVAHMFRAEQQHGRVLPHIYRCHVAIRALQLLHKAKRVLSQREQVANVG